MDALKRKMEIAAVAFFCTVTALIAACSCATTAAANLAQQTAAAPATEYVTLAYMEVQPEAEQEPELLYDVPMSDELQRYIREQAERQDVPFEIALAVIERESSYQPDAVSDTGDFGLMQINICNHRWLYEELGITDVMDPEQNIEAGLYILGQAFQRYEELERKAADLAGASERLTALEEQDEQYLAADQEAMKLLQTKNEETARIQSWLKIKESEVTHIRSRAIMLETCGCPVENPECRFLQDAVEAKKKLPAAETELETYRQQAEERTEQLDAEYQTAKKKATGLNCRKDLQAQRFLVADLRKASERFAKLTAQKERLAEVKERIKAIDEELETIPANIESLEADRFVVEDELKKLRQNAAELASIEAQLSDVKKYIELEKLLPVRFF